MVVCERPSFIDYLEKGVFANFEKAGNVVGYFPIPLGTGKIRVIFGLSEAFFGIFGTILLKLGKLIASNRSKNFWEGRTVRFKSYVTNGVGNVVRGIFESVPLGGLCVGFFWDTMSLRETTEFQQISWGRIKYMGEIKVNKHRILLKYNRAFPLYL